MATYDIDDVDVSALKSGDIINCDYSGLAKSITLPTGQYQLECWGAQGGSYSSYNGGAGGYSVGTLQITEDILLYLYAGGQPATSTSSSVIIDGGFNGGGKARYHSYSGTTTYCQAGGGATDIRIGQDSLYARVIVAGGGGGSASVNALTTKYGGGLTGGSPQSGYGATQTSAGTNGSFGIGGNGYTSGYNYKYASGGGGGGWYGGGAINSHSDSTNYRNYNGGGSGYVYIESTASNYPSGCLLNSTYYLTDASTTGGNQSITEPDGTTAIGHSGDGYIRITVLEVSGGINGRINVDGNWKNITDVYVKTLGSWKKATGLYIKKNGIWMSAGGGSGPSPGPTPSTRTLITQESVLTVADSTMGGAYGDLSYHSQITADPLVVTIGNDEYVLNRRQIDTSYYYGADLYFDDNDDLKADFTSNYWFTILADGSSNALITSSANTYSIKLESDSALHVLRLLPSNYEYVGATPTSPENMYADVDSSTDGSCSGFGNGYFTLNGFSLSTLPTNANVVNFDVRIKLTINTGTPKVEYGLADMETTSEDIVLSGNIARVYTFSNDGFNWNDFEAAWNEYYEDSKFLGIRLSITNAVYMAQIYGAELDVIYEL